MVRVPLSPSKFQAMDGLDFTHNKSAYAANSRDLFVQRPSRKGNHVSSLSVFKEERIITPLAWRGTMLCALHYVLCCAVFANFSFIHFLQEYWHLLCSCGKFSWNVSQLGSTPERFFRKNENKFCSRRESWVWNDKNVKAGSQWEGRSDGSNTPVQSYIPLLFLHSDTQGNKFSFVAELVHTMHSQKTQCGPLAWGLQPSNTSCVVICYT